MLLGVPPLSTQLLMEPGSLLHSSACSGALSWKGQDVLERKQTSWQGMDAEPPFPSLCILGLPFPWCRLPERLEEVQSESYEISYFFQGS